jgi:predicted ribosome quality control (RQC) complex YloA/Tae2 family protein
MEEAVATKQGMTSVDVAALAAELGPLLVGARVDRAYQPAKERILLRLRKKGTGRLDLLMEIGSFATVTQRAIENPEKPSMLAQVLRNELENSRLIGLHQVGFDRILRLDFERGDGRRSLVAELFGDGNMLLLDGDDKITLPMRGEDHGARSLRKGQTYQPPPGSPSPLGRSVDEWRQAGAAASRDLVRFLAGPAGWGPQWAEEILVRAGLAKDLPSAAMTDAQWEALHGAVQRLSDEVRRNDLAPCLVHDAAGELVDALPFLIQLKPGLHLEETPTWREALDTFFVGGPAQDEEGELEDPRKPRYEAAKGKLEHQAKQMRDAIADFIAQEDAAKADGDALYADFAGVQEILMALSQGRKNLDWKGLEAKLAEGRKAGNPAAKRVLELRSHEATALILAGPRHDQKVEVDVRLTIQENAQAAYALGKKARSRRDGAEAALKDTQAKIDAVVKAGLDAFGPAPVKIERTSRHFWFESYRWTVTSGGFVAVGGRNAGQNDAVVKKYLRDGDRYVHAEIHGAPSIVVRKAEGPPMEVPNDDLRQACHFAVVASRAWRQFGQASAYWVMASQVSKTARSGEYVPKGAWMVHGKRNVEPDLLMEWYVAPVRIASEGRPLRNGESAPREFTKLVGASRDSLRPYAARALRLVPGAMDPQDAASELATRFNVTQEEAAAVLPAGPVTIVGEVEL